MTLRQTPPNWTQPSLMPIHWPLIQLQSRWLIPSDGGPVMVGYDVTGVAATESKLAGGIEWCQNVHDPAQRAEVFHDLVRIAVEHLSPF